MPGRGPRTAGSGRRGLRASRYWFNGSDDSTPSSTSPPAASMAVDELQLRADSRPRPGAILRALTRGWYWL